MTFELSNYKDVDNDILPIVTEFYSLRDSGNYDEAYNLAKKYENILKPYKIDCTSFNKIELGIYNLAKELFYSQKIILSDNEPHPDEYKLNENSEWLKEY